MMLPRHLRTALCAAPSGYGWKFSRRSLVEGQDASGKVLRERHLRFIPQTVAPFTPGQNFDSVKNLRHGYRGGEEFGRLLL